MMKTITQKQKAEKALRELWKNSEFIIRENFEFKKILNDFYNPDEYLFFEYDNEIVPLVVKDGLVTFYGGVHYNEYNVLPKNEKFLNLVIDELDKMKLSFRLLSIVEDYKDRLDKEFFKRFDVPFSAYWVYDDIKEYSLEKVLENKKSRSRNNLTRCIKKIDNYRFESIDNIDILKILKKGEEYFKSREIGFGWSGRFELFSKIFDFLKKDLNLFAEVAFDSKDEAGVYVVVYNDRSLLYLFGMPLKNDNCISAILYDRLLNRSKEIANLKNLRYLDAMKGGFRYKPLFNFKPKPLYALVKDSSWKRVLNGDFDIETYNEIFNRSLSKDMLDE